MPTPLADDGWQQGWHERNGGNLTYRMKLEDSCAICEIDNKGEKHRVIYHAHPANTIALTFGLMHTVEKSAEILVKVYSITGGAKRQTIQSDEFRNLTVDFGVTLTEKFRFEKHGCGA